MLKLSALLPMAALVIPLVSAAAESNQRADVLQAIENLKDARPEVRSAAADRIRDILKQNPAAAQDPGESYWNDKFMKVEKGMDLAHIRELTGAEGGGDLMHMCSGGSCYPTLRLDDYWTVNLVTSNDGHLLERREFLRTAKSFWVDPPKGFTGKWITYFLNGRPAHDQEYLNGKVTKHLVYYDNGQLTYGQTHPNGNAEHPEIGYYRDGRKMYEGTYQADKMVGTWIHWYPSGKKQAEQIYLNGHQKSFTQWYENGQKKILMQYDERGKEKGQAAWKEDGSLQFAHGSTADLGTPKK